MKVKEPGKGNRSHSGLRRSQAERSQATREALIAAARPLFAKRGYADVGAEEIVRDAGLTRGALYHHFGGKKELLAAVYEQIEEELVQRIASEALGATDPIEALQAGMEMFLDACLEPDVQRIVLLDSPAVLGWERWRDIAARYGLGLVEGTLGAAMESGAIAEQPVRPLAHVLMGAMDEAAMLVARSDDPAATRTEVAATLRSLLAGLRP